MSKKVFARNQSFVFHTINTSQNPKSAVCTITINNSATPEYTLIDNNLEIVGSVAYAKFEISSLVRDFIEIDPPTYVSNNMYSPNFTNTAIEVDTSIRFYDANNGLGTALGSAKKRYGFLFRRIQNKI